jgi:hypothetical protein
MDEEEKPFPIEFIVILLLIAVANDVAEIFFDLLDFTGVGLAGEGVMEPANLVLDFFFTGIFWWKVGPGGGTITQYIGDLLEPLFIPGRTISVGLGIWIANHPNSMVGKVATEAAALEAGEMAHPASEGWVDQGGGVYSKHAGSTRTYGELTGEEGGSTHIKEGTPDSANEKNAESKPSEGQSDGENDIFKNPYDNPVGTAQEEEFNPSEDAIQEGKGFGNGEEPQEDSVQPQKGIHIVSRRAPVPPKQDHTENAGDEELDEAA